MRDGRGLRGGGWESKGGGRGSRGGGRGLRGCGQGSRGGLTESTPDTRSSTDMVGDHD